MPNRNFITDRTNSKNQIKAFTLAEVLITLSIIGVVAAITIPALMNNIQDAQYKNSWKKAYSNMSQVATRVVQDNGGSLKGIFNDQFGQSAKDLFKQNLSYIRDCDSADSAGKCWSTSVKNLSNTYSYTPYNNAALVLKDGMSILFFTNATGGGVDCSWTISTDLKICGYADVDVNGFTKGPNQLGKDIYSFWILENRILPEGTVQDHRDNCSTGNTDTNAGSTCSAKYLYE